MLQDVHLLLVLAHLEEYINKIHKQNTEMQAYGSRLRRIIRRLTKWCWAESIFCAFAPIPSKYQPMKQTRSLQWVLLGEDFVISSTCGMGGRQFDSQKDQLQNGLELSWDTYPWFSAHFLCSWATVCDEAGFIIW